MRGRILLPANPELSVREANKYLKSQLKELESDTGFVMTGYKTNPHNINEYIIYGRSELFEEEYGLHHVGDNGFDDVEFWLVPESYENDGYEYDGD